MFDKRDNKNYAPDMNAQESTAPETISASRIPAMLGMDPRCSPLTLFLRLKGDLGEQYLDGDVAIQQGRFYERATADWACAEYGMTIVEGFEQKTLKSGVLSGHPDFLAVDEHGKLVILEVKNPFWSYSGDDWGEPGSDQVPKPYFVQALVYAHLFREWNQGLRDMSPGQMGEIEGREMADYVYVVAKRSGGIERYKIPYDQAIVDSIVKEVEMFLTRVQIDDPPDPQDEEDMRNRWPVVEGKEAECNEAFVEQLKALASVKKQIKALETQKSELQAMVLAFAKDADKIVYVDHDGNRQTMATLGANRKFDSDACLAAHPELLTKGFAKLDVSKLGREQKALHEMFMVKPEKATEQTRVIRLKLPKEGK